jgi:hypothetical protein
MENRLTYQCPSSWPVCHYNEEEISRHLEKKLGYWPVQMNGNKFATGQILKKTGRSCEGVDFSWLNSKVSRTLILRGSLKGSKIGYYVGPTVLNLGSVNAKANNASRENQTAW